MQQGVETPAAWRSGASPLCLFYCGEDGKHWIEVEWLCIWPTKNEFTT